METTKNTPTIILHERQKPKKINSYIESSIVRYSKSIEVDIIFSDCKPSLAFCIFDMENQDDVARFQIAITKMQICFKNCFAIFYGDNNNEAKQIQLIIPSGNARMVFCDTFESTIDIILNIYTLFQDEEKLKMQQQYFIQQVEMSVSSKSALNIMLGAMSRMSIEEKDAELIIDACGSIIEIMNSEAEELLESCPIEIDAAESVAQFFGAIVE